MCRHACTGCPLDVCTCLPSRLALLACLISSPLVGLVNPHSERVGACVNTCIRPELLRQQAAATRAARIRGCDALQQFQPVARWVCRTSSIDLMHMMCMMYIQTCISSVMKKVSARAYL